MQPDPTTLAPHTQAILAAHQATLRALIAGDITLVAQPGERAEAANSGPTTQPIESLADLPAIGARWPAESGVQGIYAGVTTTPDGAIHALVLLDAAPTSDLNYDQAMTWAEALGATLPTRPESALLFANCKAAFEARWHWTCEQYSAHDAWFQGFAGGYQGNAVKSYEGRARAVRRFKLSA